MNQIEFGKLHGVTRKTVNEWKRRGWLVFDGKKINVEESNKLIEKYRKKSNLNPENENLGDTSKGYTQGDTFNKVKDFLAANGVTMTINEAKVMKENYLALSAKVDYEMKIGLLLPFNNMLDAVKLEYSRLRTRLVAIAPEQGPRLRVMATTSTDQEFVDKLQEAIYEAMRELSLDERNQRDPN